MEKLLSFQSLFSALQRDSPTKPPFLGDLGGLVAIIPDSNPWNLPKRHKTDRLSFHPHTKYSIPMASFFLWFPGVSPKKTWWNFNFWLVDISPNKKNTTHDLHRLRLFDPFFGYHLSCCNEVDPLQDLFSQGKSLGGFTGEDQNLQDGFGYRVFPVIRHGHIF